MKLSELVPWLERGDGVRGIPETDVDNCPRGLLINITDVKDDAKMLKMAKGLMPTFADLKVVKIGKPKPEPIKPKPKPKAKKTIAEATKKEKKKSGK